MKTTNSMSFKEAMKYLQMGEEHLHRLITERKIPAVDISKGKRRFWRFKRADLRAYRDRGAEQAKLNFGKPAQAKKLPTIAAANKLPPSNTVNTLLVELTPGMVAKIELIHTNVSLLHAKVNTIGRKLREFEFEFDGVRAAINGIYDRLNKLELLWK